MKLHSLTSSVFFFFLFSFSLHAQKNDKFSMAIFGDMGTGESMQFQVGKAMFQRCQKVHCQFVLGLGDNIYQDGVTSVDDPQFITKFENAYKSFGETPFYMTLGNHDYHQNPQAEIEYSQHSPRWRMPNNYYLIPNLPSWVKIMVLDSMQKNNPKQWEFFQKEMCSFKGLKIISVHHPMWSVGEHGNDPDMQTILWPLIKKCNINLVFSGHDHDQEHMLREGVNLFVEGAGAKLTAVNRGNMEENHSLYATSTNGFAVLELDGEKEIWEIQFFNQKNQKIYSFQSTFFPQKL